MPDPVVITWHSELFGETADNVPDIIDHTGDVVEEFLNTSRDFAESAIATANQTIHDLAAPNLIPDLPDPPEIGTLTTNANIGSTFVNPVGPFLGEIVPEHVAEFVADTIDVPDFTDEIPAYTPVITGLTIPTPPIFAPPQVPSPPGLDLSFDAGTPPTADYGVPAEFDAGAAPTPNFGVAPVADFGDAPTPHFGVQPEPDFGQAPVPSFGLAPTPGYGSAPTPGYGTAPTPDYGNPPTLLDLNLPTYTAPVLPLFDDAAPEFDVVVPNPIVQWTEPVYSSDVRDAIKLVLTQMLAGGTGLAPPVELAIWERGRQREDSAAAKLVGEAMDQWASRGFDYPPGFLNGQIIAVREASERTVNELSRDVMVKQADLEQTNRNFAVDKGITYEQVYVGMFLQIVDRNFQIAKFNVETQIQIYNMQVTAFNVRQAVFAQKTERFKILLEAAFAQLKVFLALIEAEKAKAAINESQVNVFKARVDAYQTQVQAFGIKVDAYGKEVGAFGTRVDAYGKEVGAYSARVGAYGQEVQAWNGKVDAFGKRVGAYSVTVEAYGKEVQAYDTKVGAFGKRAQVYGIGVEAYKAETGAYATRVDAYGKRIAAFNALVDAFGKRVEAYKAFVESEVARSGQEKLKVDVYKSQIDAMNGQVTAQRGAFEAYAAQVQGESAKAGLEESNARVFASKVQAFAAKSEIGVKRAEARIAVSRQRLDWSIANVQRITAMAGQQLNVIQAKLAGYQASTSRSVAEFGATTTVKQAEVQALIEMGRLNLGRFTALLEQWKARGTQILAAAQIQAESLRAAGQIASNLASGAMAGMHVSAGISGSAQSSQSRSDSKHEGKTFGQTTSDAYSVAHTFPHKAT